MTDTDLWQLEIERWRRSIRDLGEDIRRRRLLIDRRVTDTAGELEIERIAAKVASYEQLIISVQAQIDALENDR